MPVDATQVAEAIETWLATATGLPVGPDTGGVSGIYNDLAKVGGIAQPYVTYKIGAFRRADGASVHDESLQNYDGTNPNGQQIVYTVVGRREFTLTVDARSKSLIGSGTAQELTDKILSAAQRVSMRQVFNDAGLALLGYETPVDLSEREGPMGTSRVVQDFYFGVVSLDTDTGTWIQTVTTPVGTLGP